MMSHILSCTWVSFRMDSSLIAGFAAKRTRRKLLHTLRCVRACVLCCTVARLRSLCPRFMHPPTHPFLGGLRACVRRPSVRPSVAPACALLGRRHPNDHLFRDQLNE